MSELELFNVIVEIYSKVDVLNFGVLQNVWESIFDKILGFGSKGDLVKTVSSTPNCLDYLLLKNNSALFRAGFYNQLNLSQTVEMNFLKSLNDNNLSIGILIGSSIFIYANNTTTKSFDRLEIKVSKDNIKGEWFVKSFKKLSFSSEDIRNFVCPKPKMTGLELDALQKTVNNELVMRLLKQHFAGAITPDQFDTMMKGIVLTVMQRSQMPVSQQNTTFTAPLPFGQTSKAEQDRTSQIVSSTISSHRTQVALGNGIIQRQQAIKMVQERGIGANANFSFVSENKSINKYICTVPIDFLKTEWVLILNNSTKREINIFVIPPKLLTKKNFYSVDKQTFNISIRCRDMTYQDEHNKLKFDRFFVETIPYA